MSTLCSMGMNQDYKFKSRFKETFKEKYRKEYNELEKRKDVIQTESGVKSHKFNENNSFII